MVKNKEEERERVGFLRSHPYPTLPCLFLFCFVLFFSRSHLFAQSPQSRRLEQASVNVGVWGVVEKVQRNFWGVIITPKME